MSLATRIANRLRRSVRRRAKNALDTVESWLLQAPRTSPSGEAPPPLVSPGPAPRPEETPPLAAPPAEAAAPEPLPFPDADEAPTADPRELAPEPDEEPEMAEIHTLPSSGLQFEQVEELLQDMVRPALQMDGGDIRLVRVDPDGDVFVELEGACTTCPSATITMRNGIERLMADQLPGFRSLVEVHGVGDGDVAPGPG